MSVLPSTVERVPLHTAPEINERIRRKTDETVLRMRSAGPERIRARLGELDREWDIERAIEVNAATVGLIGLGLSIGVDRRFLVLPVAVFSFLLQHAVQGWCPPVPVLRRLGFRTASEIERERDALRALLAAATPVS